MLKNFYTKIHNLMDPLYVCKHPELLKKHIAVYTLHEVVSLFMLFFCFMAVDYLLLSFFPQLG